MNLSTSKIIFLAGLMFTLAESVPTCDQISTMTQAILDKMNTETEFNPLYNFRALCLRLGFHDCVGGCNGCINFNNPDNAGLESVVAGLNSTYYTNGFDKIVTLADFFALAATVSIRDAVEVSNMQRSGTLSSPCPLPCFSLQWGRSDVGDCSNDPSELPSPLMTGDQMYNYFYKEFKFTKDQVVALMGAHSFGSTDSRVSGYTGKWTGAQNKGLSEIFYSHMVNPGLAYRNLNVADDGNPPKWEFKANFATNGTNAGMMFNTDFELFYNLTLDESGRATCNLNHLCGLTNSCTNYCPMSSTFQTALGYSKSCPVFMKDFQSVITLMLANGYKNLKTTTCSC